MKKIGAMVFEDFELLDLFGPLEMFGVLDDEFSIEIVGGRSGPVRSRQGPCVHTDVQFAANQQYDLLLVPGGIGTRKLVTSDQLLDWIRGAALKADFVLSVCTGSALLAAAGLLDGRKATSNKLAFEWVVSQGPNVIWEMQARWVKDGRFYTSSGVAAGIDMSLGVISDLLGEDKAQHVANWTEYTWHKDAGFDPFAKIHGLI